MNIELKTGYSDDGPAWISFVKTSKTGNTIYFNDHAFQKQTGYYSNYVDIENGDEYWISGVKRTGSNRHQCGRGRIQIDSRAVEAYLDHIGEKELPHGYEVVEIEEVYPTERIKLLLGRFIHKRILRSKTSYIVTERRFFRHINGETTMLSFDSRPSMSVEYYKDGSGKIIFNSYQNTSSSKGFDWSAWLGEEEYTIGPITDVNHVYQLIQSLEQ